MKTYSELKEAFWWARVNVIDCGVKLDMYKASDLQQDDNFNIVLQGLSRKYQEALQKYHECDMAIIDHEIEMQSSRDIIHNGT